MSKSLRQYLQDMLERIERIEQVATAGKQAFHNSIIRQDAAIRNYEVIGEIAKRLLDDILDCTSGVNWAQIKGFRDFLAHNYDRVDLAVVWNAIEQLSDLRVAVETMLSEAGE